MPWTMKMVSFFFNFLRLNIFLNFYYVIAWVICVFRYIVHHLEILSIDYVNISLFCRFPMKFTIRRARRMEALRKRNTGRRKEEPSNFIGKK